MGTRRTKLSLFALLLTVALTSTAYAADQVWDGTTDLNWSTGTNWVGDPADTAVPGSGGAAVAGDEASFTAAPAGTVVLDAAMGTAIDLLTNGAGFTLTLDLSGQDVTVTTLTVGDGDTLALTNTGAAATVTVTDQFTPGTGIVTVGANVTLVFTGGYDPTGAATLTSSNVVQFLDATDFTGATVNNTGTFEFDSTNGSFAVTDGTQVDGDVEVTAAVNTVTFDVLDSIDNITVSGAGNATVTNDLDATAAVAVSGTGKLLVSVNTTVGTTVTVDGGGEFEVTGTGDIDGNVVISSGTLDLDSATSFAGSALTFTGGTIEISGDATFDNAGAQTVTVASATDFTGAISTDDGALVAWTGALTLGGTLRVAEAADANPGSLTISGAFDDGGSNINVRQEGTLNFDGNVTLNNGGTLTVDNNADAVTFSAATNTFGAGSVANSLIITFDGGIAQAVTSATADLGNVTVTAASTVVTFGDATDLDDLSIETGASAVFTTFAVTIAGDLTLAGTAALTAGSGLFTFDGGAAQDITSPTALTFAAVTVNGGTVRVDPGVTNATSVDITGALTVTTGSFGADEDAGSSTGATITVGGDTRVDAANGLKLGEGTYNFGADIDLGATANQDDVVELPTSTNDFATVINLTGTGAVALSIEDAAAAGDDSGSFFWIDSVVDATAITLVGNLKLVGALDLSASSATTSLSGAAGDLQITEEALGTAVVTLNAASAATFDDVYVDEITQPFSTTITTTNTLAFATGGTSVTIDTLTVEGDTDNTDSANNGDETNNGAVTFTDLTVAFTGVVALNDGDDVGTESGLGGSLSFENCDVTFGGNVNVGQAGAVADENAEGASFSASQGASGTVSSFEFAGTTTFTVNAFATLDLEDTTFTSDSTDDYTVAVVATAQSVDILNSTLTAGAVNGLTITLGSADLSVVQSNFSNYATTGVQIAAATGLTALNQNTFTNGQASGTHLSFLGAITTAGNNTLDADGNKFDDSTLTGGAITAGNGEIVSVANDTDDVALNFRAAAADSELFGSGFTLAEGTDGGTDGAEGDDNDGTDANEGGGDDDVTWDDSLASLTVGTPAATTPMYAATATGTSTLATAMTFTLTAATTDASVTALTVDIDTTGLTAGSITNGAVGQLVLFRDDDASGTYDAGEDVGGVDSAVTIVAGQAAFTGLTETILTTAAETWGVAFLTSANAAGSIDLEIDLGGITTTPGLVLGLPTATATVDIQGSNLTVAANTANGTADAVAKYTASATPTVLAFDVTNAATNDASVSGVVVTVTATGGATLTDAIVEAFIGNLALFSSDDTSFDSTYDRTDLTDYGATGDDDFFAIVAAGANINFASSVATVTFTPATNVTVDSSASFFLVLDPTTTTADRSAALSAGLKLSFELGESATETGATGGLRTAGGAQDDVAVTDNDTNATGDQITSRLWTLVSGSSTSSSCSLDSASSTSTFAWLVALLGALSVVMVRRRRQEA